MENRHQPYDLAQMQSLPLHSKIRMTQQRIKQWYEHWDGNVHISVSGGKDSQVLAHIVKEMYPDVPCVFVNTGLEYDCVRRIGTELSDKVLKPEIPFARVIKEYGYPIISKEVSNCVEGARRYLNELKRRESARQSFDRQTFHIPTTTEEYVGLANMLNRDWGKVKGSPQRLAMMMGMRDKNRMVNIPSEIKDRSQYSMIKYQYLLEAPFRISEKCCSIMKKHPSALYEKENDSHPYLGIMASESRLRMQKWMQHGCNAFEIGRPKSQPLSFWTEQDILLYIKENNLKIADVYGDIVYTDDDGMFYDNDLFNADMKLTTTGAKRTGCVFCMFGIQYDTEKFLRLKEIEPKKFDYLMRGGKFDENGLWIPYKGL